MTTGMDRNNPFDIEPNDIQWVGETAKTAPITFDSMHDGLRAGIKVFFAYQREGHNTVAKAIMIFAPPSENPTAQYIANMCDWCGVTANQVLDFHDPSFMLKWAKGIIRQEQGEDALKLITDDMILLAVAAAQSEQPKTPKARSLHMKMPLDPPKTAGVMLGTYIANLIIQSVPVFLHVPVTESAGTSITGLCILLAVHFFKNPTAPV